MSPDKAVYQALLTSGLPGVNTQWRLGSVPDLPWFVFRRAKGGEFKADNSDYAKMVRYRAELWMPEKDAEVRKRFEDAVSLVGPFTTNESWVATENAYQVEYSFTYHPGTLLELGE